MNFWQGRLIRLRGVEPSDAAFLFNWNRDSEMARNIDFVWPPVSQAQITEAMTEQSKKTLENDAFNWIMEDISGAPVGSITTHTCNPRTGTFSYGLGVMYEHQRKGYASEAITLVLRYYFEELRYQKANAQVYSHNPVSMALHEKLGFVREGTLRRMIYTKGQYYDVHWYGLTREEWDQRALKP